MTAKEVVWLKSTGDKYDYYAVDIKWLNKHMRKIHKNSHTYEPYDQTYLKNHVNCFLELDKSHGYDNYTLLLLENKATIEDRIAAVYNQLVECVPIDYSMRTEVSGILEEYGYIATPEEINQLVQRVASEEKFQLLVKKEVSEFLKDKSAP